MKGLSAIQKTTLWIILCSGAILRLYNYSGWSLSNDELSALNRLHYTSFSEVIEQGVKLNDMHPPGVQAFLYLWTGLFGIDENVLRLPFVVLGIASIYLLFLVVKNWFNTNVALLTSAAFATLIFPILYSQLARPYSPGLFFSLLAVYCWTKLLNRKNDKYFPVAYYSGFIIAGVACMYIHYFTFLFLAIIGITGLFYVKGKMRVYYLMAGVIMFLTLLPNFSVYLYQLRIGGIGGAGGWLGAPKPSAVFQLISYIFNESLFLLSFYIFITAVFVFFNSKNYSKNKFQLLSFLFFLIPFLIAYFYSVFKNPVYQHSIMLFSFPYLLIFVFSFLPANFSDKKTFVLSLFILTVTVISTIAEKKFYTTQYFGVFKEIADKTTAYQNKYGEKNITAVANVIFPYYINYYHQKQGAPAPYKLYNCSSPIQLEKLNELALKSSTSYFSYVWSNTANPEEVQQIVSQYYPKIIERVDYFNSGARLFAKVDVKEPGLMLQPSFSYLNDFEQAIHGPDSLMLTEKILHSGKRSVLYTSGNEYGPTFKHTLKEINFSDSCTIWLKVWVYSEILPIKASLVLQVNDGDKTILWRGADVQDYIIKPSTWQPVFLAYRFNESISKDAVISTYVWNSGKAKFYVDDFSITVIP